MKKALLSKDKQIRKIKDIKNSEYQGRWNDNEHNQFLKGLKIFGKNWKKIDTIIQTRNCSQIRSHAQKYFYKMKQNKNLNQILDECKENINIQIDFQKDSYFSNKLQFQIQYKQNIKSSYTRNKFERFSNNEIFRQLKRLLTMLKKKLFFPFQFKLRSKTSQFQKTQQLNFFICVYPQFKYNLQYQLQNKILKKRQNTQLSLNLVDRVLIIQQQFLQKMKLQEQDLQQIENHLNQSPQNSDDISDQKVLSTSILQTNNTQNDQSQQQLKDSKLLDIQNTDTKKSNKYFNSFTFLEQDFYFDKNYQFYAPAPKYLPLSIVQQNIIPITSKERWNGLEIKKDGEIKCVDKQILKRFEGIIKDLLKNVAESIAQGRGMVGVSMPIRIFEPRSMNERIIDQFCYIPKYISNLSSNDPIERMKGVATFVYAGLTLSISQLKPFTPLLGETYEGELEDGTKIFCEHIIHHPPIVSFYIVGKGFKYYGSYEFQARPNFNYNVIRMIQEGINTIEFDDGQKITWYMPCVRIQGLLMGDRLVARTGPIVFQDTRNQLKCVILLGKKGSGLFGKDQVDICKGKLYYYNNQEEQLDQKKLQNMDLQAICEHDYLSQIADIEGSYNKNLKIGDVEVWNIEQNQPSRLIAVDQPLPSDSRYREDLIWLKYGNDQYAQKWKIRVEAQQKIDRQLRLVNSKQ